MYEVLTISDRESVKLCSKECFNTPKCLKNAELSVSQCENPYVKMCGHICASVATDI